MVGDAAEARETKESEKLGEGRLSPGTTMGRVQEKQGIELSETGRGCQYLRSKLQPHSLHRSSQQLVNCQAWKSSTQPWCPH